jgi:hypothetical protein
MRVQDRTRRADLRVVGPSSNPSTYSSIHPVSPAQRWTQRHTQRLRDTIRPEVQLYVQPGALYRWARQKEVAWESVPVLGVAAWVLRQPAWWNAFKTL